MNAELGLTVKREEMRHDAKPSNAYRKSFSALILFFFFHGQRLTGGPKSYTSNFYVKIGYEAASL